ncbi:MAG: hypothetical protein DWQ30_22185 [Acidobacteria bacterium]|nr:MAG: hypothetical protein DWQ30_22185 [Acidobacteriota bacterium]
MSLLRRRLDERTILLAIVLLAAFALSMHGGTPLRHPDSLVGRAYHALTNAGDPGFFHYPALGVYLNAAAYAVYRVLAEQATPELLAHLASWPWVDLPGHLVTATFSAAGVGAAFLIAARLAGLTAGFVAAATLVSAPLWNADAHYVTVDIPLAALCALALAWLTCRGEKAAGLHFDLAAGAWIGLATAMKYNGFVLAVPFVVVLAARTGFTHRLVLSLLRTAAVAISVFFLCNPYALVRHHLFRSHLKEELAHSRQGHPGYDLEAWHQPLTSTLPTGLGLVPLMLAVAGLIWIWRDRGPSSRANAAALSAFLLAYFALVATSTVDFDRYALPLLPVVAALCGVGVSELGRAASGPNAGRLGQTIALLVSLGLGVAIGWNLDTCMRHNALLGTDTRTVVRNLLELAPEADIALSPFLAADAPSSARLLAPSGAEGSDLLLVDSFGHDRLLYDPDVPADQGVELSVLRRSEAALVVSPFQRPKQGVAFSPKSVYSPYPPDLWARSASGPYVEIYGPREQLEHLVERTGQASPAIRVSLAGRNEAFYYKRLLDSGPCEAVRSDR